MDFNSTFSYWQHTFIQSNLYFIQPANPVLNEQPASELI